MCILSLLSLNPNGFFLCGDTAQTIGDCCQFRFEEIRDVFYKLMCGNLEGAMQTCSSPQQTEDEINSAESSSEQLKRHKKKKNRSSEIDEIHDKKKELYDQKREKKKVACPNVEEKIDFSLIQKAQQKFYVPEITQLLKNFRTHNGILSSANRLVEHLYNYFPNQIDKLKNEYNEIAGHPPSLIPMTFRDHSFSLLETLGHLFGSDIRLGADSVILVRSPQEKEIVEKFTKNAIVLTVLESKGLEFDKVIIIDFFGSSSFASWRIFATENPLKFDSLKHGTLSYELKLLYVAMTRAKKLVFLIERNRFHITNILNIFRCKADSARTSEYLVDVMSDEDVKSFRFPSDTSSNEQYKSRAEQFLRLENFKQAERMYHLANDSDGADLCRAEILIRDASLKSQNLYLEYSKLYRSDSSSRFIREKTQQLIANPNIAGKLLNNIAQEINSLYFQAANLYSKIKKHSKAAICYEKCGHFETAGDLFCQSNSLESAATCFRNALNFSKAADIFQKLEKFRLAAAMFLQAKMYDRAIDVCGTDDRLRDTVIHSIMKLYQKLNKLDMVAKYASKLSSIPEKLKILENIGAFTLLIDLEKKNFLFQRIADRYFKNWDFYLSFDYYKKAFDHEKINARPQDLVRLQESAIKSAIMFLRNVMWCRFSPNHSFYVIDINETIIFQANYIISQVRDFPIWATKTSNEIKCFEELLRLEKDSVTSDQENNLNLIAGSNKKLQYLVSCFLLNLSLHDFQKPQDIRSKMTSLSTRSLNFFSLHIELMRSITQLMKGKYHKDFGIFSELFWNINPDESDPTVSVLSFSSISEVHVFKKDDFLPYDKDVPISNLKKIHTEKGLRKINEYLISVSKSINVKINSICSDVQNLLKPCQAIFYQRHIETQEKPNKNSKNNSLQLKCSCGKGHVYPLACDKNLEPFFLSGILGYRLKKMLGEPGGSIENIIDIVLFTKELLWQSSDIGNLRFNIPSDIQQCILQRMSMISEKYKPHENLSRVEIRFEDLVKYLFLRDFLTSNVGNPPELPKSCLPPQVNINSNFCDFEPGANFKWNMKDERRLILKSWAASELLCHSVSTDCFSATSRLVECFFNFLTLTKHEFGVKKEELSHSFSTLVQIAERAVFLLIFLRQERVSVFPERLAFEISSIHRFQVLISQEGLEYAKDIRQENEYPIYRLCWKMFSSLISLIDFMNDRSKHFFVRLYFYINNDSCLLVGSDGFL